MSWFKPFVKKCNCSKAEKGLQSSRNTTTGNSQLQKCEVLTSVIVSVQISLVVSVGTTDKTLSVDVHLALM